MVGLFLRLVFSGHELAHFIIRKTAGLNTACAGSALTSHFTVVLNVVQLLAVVGSEETAAVGK